MKINSIRSIRRNELSRAAFEAVVQFGLRGTTLDRVGDIAGVSKGVVLHHFKDKSNLLEAVFRRSNSILSESVVELYQYAESPHERLWCIIVANFASAIFNQRVCQAWVSLISEVPHNKPCQRIQIACNARIQSNLTYSLRNFLGEQESKDAARHLGMLIDGIWVRSGLLVDPVDSSRAISELQFAVSKIVPSDAISQEKHRKAREKIESIASLVLGSKAFKEKSLKVISK